MKYTWDWNVDYKAQNREKCKNCKHCWIGFPRKLVGCTKLLEEPKNGICEKFEEREKNERNY